MLFFFIYPKVFVHYMFASDLVEHSAEMNTNTFTTDYPLLKDCRDKLLGSICLIHFKI